jgi:hypothetical protein
LDKSAITEDKAEELHALLPQARIHYGSTVFEPAAK